jgi:hypothetical protein
MTGSSAVASKSVTCGIGRHSPLRHASLGPDPERTSYWSFFSFNDPDGNLWLVQEVTTRVATVGSGSPAPGACYLKHT